MTLRRLIALALTLLALPSWAAAHAFLDRAEPRVGAELNTAPEQLKIWFTQDIEPAFSKIQVFDSNGKEVDQKDAHADAKDKKLLVVSLSALSAGTYKVSWHVVSVDTHRTQGDFRFVVKQ
jgi:hypothetical protein